MAKNTSKRKKDIKSKLLAAICMLLVSTIMMVSSTYAWFTLSTAPEVTGITTAVGANGNLEMALLPTTGLLSDITSGVGDSMYTANQTVKDANTTWGNLVDLSDSGYGLNQITLNPSALNLVDGKIAVNGFILKTPSYGADGRITELNANAVTAAYNGTQFVPGLTMDDITYGVRAVGVASGMTDRQLAYRNANFAASSAMSSAQTQAANSLAANGNTLANIVLAKATKGDSATYSATDVKALQAIVDDLLNKVLPQIDEAYMQSVLAYSASQAVTNELAWKAVKGLVEAEGATITTVLADLATLTDENGDAVSITVPSELTTVIGYYQATLKKVQDADTALDPLMTQITDAETLNSDSDDTNNVTVPTFVWGDIDDALNLLANTETMTVNGYTPAQVKDDMNPLVQDVASGKGIVVAMGSGAGVYADIADHCGNYDASIQIDKVEYNQLVLGPLTARMETKSTVTPAYLKGVATYITENGKEPTGDSSTANPLTDMYGYIIDLGFKTNAANSNLLLQVKGTDRIYGDTNTNADTLGKGSTMTFKQETTDFSDQQVKDLMDCIRIVFFDTMTGEIYAYAKLDTANATTGVDGVTAEMYLYTLEAKTVTTYTEATYAADSGLTYYQKNADDGYTALTDADAAAATVQLYTATTTSTNELVETKMDTNANDDVNDNVITALTQNEAKAISCLVYLDGETITNADVATAGKSMSGKMNLQFASSAELKPMEYGGLYIPGEDANSGN